MSHSNVFAMSNSNLEAFLYADVGVELNGSCLTTLSMLARLGDDPWTLAARWAREPRAAAVDWLTTSIARMPLDAAGIENARLTASRLVLLLPASAMVARKRLDLLGKRLPAQEWHRAAFIGFGLLVWILLTTALLPALQKPIETSVGQTAAHSR